jgi:hypothetical protein
MFSKLQSTREVLDLATAALRAYSLCIGDDDLGCCFEPKAAYALACVDKLDAGTYVSESQKLRDVLKMAIPVLSAFHKLSDEPDYVCHCSRCQDRDRVLSVIMEVL